MRREFSRIEMRSRTILICQPCHDQIHRLISEQDLGEVYNTAESLQTHPEVAKFLDWIRRKPRGFVP